MPDMLVKLYELPETDASFAQMEEQGVVIRPTMAYEREQVVEWVRTHFGDGWASECESAFNHQPVTCIIATHEGVIRGFACYEATCRDFFGPTGVEESWRSKGIGRALLIASLQGLKAMGYGYGIIGGAGPTGFYEKACGATVIEGSVPGIYRDGLKRPVKE